MSRKSRPFCTVKEIFISVMLAVLPTGLFVSLFIYILKTGIHVPCMTVQFLVYLTNDKLHPY